jgi:polyisoprenoid-binding protein YceI
MIRKHFATAALGVAMVLGLTAAAPAAEVKVDPAHSTVLFSSKHFNAGYVWGMFLGPTGTINWDDQDASKISFNVTVPVKNLTTGDAKRDEHLKGPDFFNVKQYPDATFKSTSVKKGSEADTYEVTGDLTLRDVTKPVTVTIKKTGEGTDPWKNTRIGFESQFTVNRNDFGVKGLPGGVGDDIRLIVALEGIVGK